MFNPASILIVVSLAFIGGSFGQMENENDSPGNSVSFDAPGPPADVKMKAFKETCVKNGGTEAYTNALTAVEELEHCVWGVVNITVLEREVMDAEEIEAYDTIFKKYCGRSPALKTCYRNFTSSFEPCLTPTERIALRQTCDIGESVLDFACFENGKRLVSFMVNDGEYCVGSKFTEVESCIRNALSLNVYTGTRMPMPKFDLEECTKIVDVKDCIVNELRTCSSPTTGDLFESLFNHVKKVTPCESLLSNAR